MDHRDARFYFWRNGVLGNCTCSHAATFPVQTVPMLQRLLRFFLPSIILAMLIILAAWLVFVPLDALFALLGKTAIGRSQIIPRPDISMRKVRPPRAQTSPPDSSPSSVNGSRYDFLLGAAAWVIAIAGGVVAALIAFDVNRTLPTIEDTATYVFQAKTFALGRLWAPIPPDFAHNSSAFILPFTVVFNGHWFGKYPPGWPALLAVGALFDKSWIVTPVVGGIVCS